MNIEQYRAAFLSTVKVDGLGTGNADVTTFVDQACASLVNGGVIADYTVCQCQNSTARGKIVAVDGFSFEESDESLSLFISEFSGDPEGLPVLRRSDVDKRFGHLVGFYQMAASGILRDRLEETDPGYDLAVAIEGRQGALSTLRLFLLTDGRLSERIVEYAGPEIDGLRVEYHIWDISRIAALEAHGHEPVEIDVQGEFGRGIPALPANLGEAGYASYLCVVPASLLANIYERYGARLLETNVRAFLQDKGKVNKGIKKTIQTEPEMFFAYNNGLSTTAASVEATKSKLGHLEITTIRDLQIVNGGQTTASLYSARKKSQIELSKIFVQMKLCVIPLEHIDEVVPRISQYANSQNKVSDADLFANHPFHRRMEEISRRLISPARGTAQHGTYWFYERARAQYQNARAVCSGGQLKSFDLKNPKPQVLRKTDIAKYELTWDQEPRIVSQGAQKSFLDFASKVSEQWDRNSDRFNEVFFKRLVAKAIVFKSTEQLITDQSWYDGGYRANIVTYGLARLSLAIEEEDKRLDFLSIWAAQGLSKQIADQIVDVCRDVASVLTSPPSGFRNVSEWCKKPSCWERIREVPVKLGRSFASSLISPELESRQDRTGVQTQVVDSGIEAQRKVLDLVREGFWRVLLDWNQQNAVLTENENRAVVRAAAIADVARFNLSESVCKTLMRARAHAEEEGFFS
jgi:hypothetical protein